MKRTFASALAVLVGFAMLNSGSTQDPSVPNIQPPIQGTVRASEPAVGVPGNSPRSFQQVNQGTAKAPNQNSQFWRQGTTSLTPAGVPQDFPAPGAISQGAQPYRLPQPYTEAFFGGQQRAKLQSAVNKKINEYRSTKEDKKKKAIEEEIRKLLSQQFDERLKGPESRIESSRKRMDELTKQVKNRSDNQKEIVDLRLKVLTNEVIGLGWSKASPHFTNVYNYQAAYDNFTGTRTFLYDTKRFPHISSTYRPTPPSSPNVASGTPVQSPRAPRSAVAGKTLPKSDQPTVHQLLNDFKKAQEKSERDSIVKELRSLLNDEFEKHQEALSNSATRIEKMISELEKNLDQRKKMKDSIVDLKLKTVINQANGLGF